MENGVQIVRVKLETKQFYYNPILGKTNMLLIISWTIPVQKNIITNPVTLSVTLPVLPRLTNS